MHLLEMFWDPVAKGAMHLLEVLGDCGTRVQFRIARTRLFRVQRSDNAVLFLQDPSWRSTGVPCILVSPHLYCCNAPIDPPATFTPVYGCSLGDNASPFVSSALVPTAVGLTLPAGCRGYYNIREEEFSVLPVAPCCLTV